MANLEYIQTGFNTLSRKVVLTKRSGSTNFFRHTRYSESSRTSQTRMTLSFRFSSSSPTAPQRCRTATKNLTQSSLRGAMPTTAQSCGSPLRPEYSQNPSTQSIPDVKSNPHKHSTNDAQQRRPRRPRRLEVGRLNPAPP